MTSHLQPVPCPPPWYQPASQCFDQVQQFEEMLQAMVDKTVTDKLNTIIQQGALPPGVVDGSDAKAGQVGEFLTGTAQINYAAYPATTSVIVSPLVLSAGDWNVWGYLDTDTAVGPTSAGLSPTPAGMSHWMYAGVGVWSGVGESVNIALPTARGSFTTPTLLPFSVIIHQDIDPSLTAGIATLKIEARRAR